MCPFVWCAGVPPKTDGISSSEVVVLQGERPLAKDNKKLGMFRLDGIPTAPKGWKCWKFGAVGDDGPTWFMPGAQPSK